MNPRGGPQMATGDPHLRPLRLPNCRDLAGLTHMERRGGAMGRGPWFATARARRTVGGLALSVVAGTCLAVLGAAPPASATPTTPAPHGIYVGDVSNQTVSSFSLSSNGDVTPNATISSSSLDGPYGEVFDASGDLWVAQYSGDELTEFTGSQLSASGSPTPVVTIGVTGGPVGLAFDRSGDLWVANYNADTLDEFTPSQLAASGSPPPA